jgi:hypothetical protein
LGAGQLKTKKKRFSSKGSEQCIKRVFFPPGYAELEPVASYLASSSGASAFFCLNRQALSSNCQINTRIIATHDAEQERCVTRTEVRGSSPGSSQYVFTKIFCFIKTPATTTNAL